MNTCFQCGDEFAGTGLLCSTCIVENIFKEEIKENSKRLTVEKREKILGGFKLRNFINSFQIIISILLLW